MSDKYRPKPPTAAPAKSDPGPWPYFACIPPSRAPSRHRRGIAIAINLAIWVASGTIGERVRPVGARNAKKIIQVESAWSAFPRLAGSPTPPRFRWFAPRSTGHVADQMALNERKCSSRNADRPFFAQAFSSEFARNKDTHRRGGQYPTMEAAVFGVIWCGVTLRGRLCRVVYSYSAAAVLASVASERVASAG